MAAAAIKFNVNVIDRGLQAKLAQMSAATGRTVKEETKTAMKGMVKYVMDYTPPASQRGQGNTAKAMGEVSVVKDMKKLFLPIVLGGEDVRGGANIHPAFSGGNRRTEKWPDPHQLHHAAVLAAGGGSIKAKRPKYRVDREKLTALKLQLQRGVGLLASGWIPGAKALGVPVPSWISRHAGSGRGTELIVTDSGGKITMKLTNHVPGTANAIAAQMQRLVQSAKTAAIGKLKRQLPYILKKNLH
jgi:hypothetical protein